MTVGLGYLGKKKKEGPVTGAMTDAMLNVSVMSTGSSSTGSWKKCATAAGTSVVFVVAGFFVGVFAGVFAEASGFWITGVFFVIVVTGAAGVVVAGFFGGILSVLWFFVSLVLRNLGSFFQKRKTVVIRLVRATTTCRSVYVVLYFRSG